MNAKLTLTALLVSLVLLASPLVARVQPSDFTYLGSFDVTCPDEWCTYGQRGLSLADGGSALWITGHTYDAQVVKIGIPPIDGTAQKLSGPTDYLSSCPAQDNWHFAGIEEVGGVIRGTCKYWYNVAVEVLNNYHDSPGAVAQHIGPISAPFRAGKMGAYLFGVPPDFAEQHLGGRGLITGYSSPAGAVGGSQGPTLMAFDSGNPASALDLVWYREHHPECNWDGLNCDYPGYRADDDWEGATWVRSAAGDAVLITGRKGLGPAYYGDGRAGDCDPDKGWHSDPYEVQIIFYDPQDIVDRLAGLKEPWEVVPYDQMTISGIGGIGECSEMGGMTYDQASGKLYVVHRGSISGGQSKIHVWQADSNPPAEMWSWGWAGYSGEYIQYEETMHFGKRITHMEDLSGNGNDYFAPFPEGGGYQVGLSWGSYHTDFPIIAVDYFSDGNNIYLQSMQQTQSMAAAEFYLAAAVMDTRDAGNRVLWGYSSSDRVRLEQFENQVTIDIGGNFHNLSVQNAYSDGPVVVEIWRDSDNRLHCWINGEDKTLGSPTESAVFDLSGIGGGPAAGNSAWDDFAFEFMAFKGLPSATGRDGVRQYLTDKWINGQQVYYLPWCGDGNCDPGEDHDSCPQDCPLSSFCGDGNCDPDEDYLTCPDDCDAPPICGDGICNGVEDYLTCPSDCEAPPPPPTEGLLAHYSLNEGSGTVARDSSGNGHHGTLVNGPQWFAGIAVDFDGQNDYIDIGPLDVPGSAITLAAWFNSDDLMNCDSGDCRLISKATSTAEDAHYFMLSTIREGDSSRLRFRLKTAGTTTTLIASSGDLSGGRWVHAAAVFDGSEMRLYKDGQLVGSTAKSGSITTNSSVPVWIGGNPDGASSMPWDGVIDEVRIYDQALTAAEILTLPPPGLGGQLFRDGFESADTSAWSAAGQ